MLSGSGSGGACQRTEEQHRPARCWWSGTRSASFCPGPSRSDSCWTRSTDKLLQARSLRDCPAITPGRWARRRGAGGPPRRGAARLLLGSATPSIETLGCAARRASERQNQTGCCGLPERISGQTAAPVRVSTCGLELADGHRRLISRALKGPARSAQASGEQGGGARAPAGLQQIPSCRQPAGSWCVSATAMSRSPVQSPPRWSGVVALSTGAGHRQQAKRALQSLLLHCLSKAIRRGETSGCIEATGNGARRDACRLIRRIPPVDGMDTERLLGHSSPPGKPMLLVGTQMLPRDRLRG